MSLPLIRNHTKTARGLLPDLTTPGRQHSLIRKRRWEIALSLFLVLSFGTSVLFDAVITTGNRATFDDDHFHAADVDTSPFGPPPVLSAGVISTGDPAVVGQWEGVYQLRNKPIHAVMFPNGTVLYWPNSGTGYMWNPMTGENYQLASQPGFNMFCAGMSLLPDGRALIAGGHVSSRTGLSDATMFDSTTSEFTRLPNMNGARWYPTNTTLPNGDVLVTSGDITPKAANELPQIWLESGERWVDLTGALRKLPWYPFMYVAPDGRVFDAGPNMNTAYLDTSGTGQWVDVATTNWDERTYGSSVMYDDGKILILGGNDGPPYGTWAGPPTNTAEVIDLNDSSPSWRYTNPMVNHRIQATATLLPDGTVLVTGGSSGPGKDDATAPVYAAELWDPKTEQWTTLASNSVYRGYHSVAFLLPDGRVISSGGDLANVAGNDALKGGKNYEIFSPPYLFKGPRPTITSAPATVEYGQSFAVDTPDGAGITEVTWIRLPSVTHAFDMSQRINRLSFTTTTNGLTVQAPTSPNLAPPGYYMLFILKDGVPSVAKIVQIDGEAAEPPAAPTNLTATVTMAGQIDLSWTDNAVNEDGFELEVSTDGGNTFAPLTTLGPDATSYQHSGLAPLTTYHYRVRAQNTIGPSDYSNVASATTLNGPPAAPTGLDATAVSSSRIDLTWTDNANNEDGFEIEWSTDNFTTSTTIEVGEDVVSYQHTGLTPGTSYSYRVRSRNSIAASDFSNTDSAMTSQVAPSAPSGLDATAASAFAIDLSWTDTATNEGGFEIEWSIDDFATSDFITVGANVVSYQHTGLMPSTTYSYRVRAYNTADYSTASNTDSATTLEPPATPAAPSGLAATASSAFQIGLTWTDNSANEDGFVIEWATGGGSFTMLDTVDANAESYQHTGLAPETEYSYRVRAFNAGGDSDYSDTATETTPASEALIYDSFTDTPGTLLQAHPGDTGHGWSKVTTFVGDAVISGDGRLRAQTKAEARYVASSVPTSSEYDIFADLYVASNKGYFGMIARYDAATGSYYRIIYNAASQRWQMHLFTSAGGKSLAVSGTTGSYPLVVGATYQLKLSILDGAKTFWVKGPGDTDYVQQLTTRDNTVKVAGQVGVLFSVGGEVGDSIGYQLDNLQVQEPGPSRPAAPSGLSATVISHTQVNLAWTDASTNETGFVIEWSNDNFVTSSAIEVGAGVTTYEHTGLTPETPYAYRVRAVNGVGSSANSNVATATTPAAPTVPSSPTALTATPVSPYQIDLAWTDTSDDEDGFVIEWSENGGTFTELASVAAGVTSYQQSGLIPETDYGYRVRAFNVAGSSADATASATTPESLAIVADTFTDTAGTLLDAHISDSGHGWSKLSGFLGEATVTTAGRLRPVTTSDARYIAAAVMPVTEYEITADMFVASRRGYAGLIARFDGTSSYYRVVYNAGGQRWLLYRVSPGTNKLIASSGGTGSYPVATGATYQLKFQVLDDAKTLWVKGPTDLDYVQVLTTPDNLIPNAGQVGVMLSSSVTPSDTVGLQLDNLQVIAAGAVAPVAPSNLSATAASATRIDLAWTDNSGNESGFEIEWSDDGTTFTQLASVGEDGTSYEHTGLTAETTYSYRIRAVNAVGSSAYSNVDAATTPPTPTVPSGPTGLTVTAVSATAIDLSWTDTADNEEGFAIEWSPDGSPASFTTLATVGVDVTSYTHENLTPETEYFYRVRAFNSTGVSGYSGVDSATTLPAPPPLIEDTFTDPANTLLETHTGDSGHGWTKATGFTGEARISAAGRLRGATGGEARYLADEALASAEYEITVDLFVASNKGTIGLLARHNGSDSYYRVQYTSGSQRWQLTRVTPTGSTTLASSGATGSFPLTVGATYQLRFSIQDDVKSFWVKGPGDADYVRLMASNDNVITGAGRVGVLYYVGGTVTDAIGYQLDNLEVR